MKAFSLLHDDGRREQWLAECAPPPLPQLGIKPRMEGVVLERTHIRLGNTTPRAENRKVLLKKIAAERPGSTPKFLNLLHQQQQRRTMAEKKSIPDLVDAPVEESSDDSDGSGGSSTTTEEERRRSSGRSSLGSSRKLSRNRRTLSGSKRLSRESSVQPLPGGGKSAGVLPSMQSRASVQYQLRGSFFSHRLSLTTMDLTQAESSFQALFGLITNYMGMTAETRWSRIMQSLPHSGSIVAHRVPTKPKTVSWEEYLRLRLNVLLPAADASGQNTNVKSMPPLTLQFLQKLRRDISILSLLLPSLFGDIGAVDALSEDSGHRSKPRPINRDGELLIGILTLLIANEMQRGGAEASSNMNPSLSPPYQKKGQDGLQQQKSSGLPQDQKIYTIEVVSDAERNLMTEIADALDLWDDLENLRSDKLRSNTEPKSSEELIRALGVQSPSPPIKTNFHQFVSAIEFSIELLSLIEPFRLRCLRFAQQYAHTAYNSRALESLYRYKEAEAVGSVLWLRHLLMPCAQSQSTEKNRPPLTRNTIGNSSFPFLHEYLTLCRVYALCSPTPTPPSSNSPLTTPTGWVRNRIPSKAPSSADSMETLLQNRTALVKQVFRCVLQGANVVFEEQLNTTLKWFDMATNQKKRLSRPRIDDRGVRRPSKEKSKRGKPTVEIALYDDEAQTAPRSGALFTPDSHRTQALLNLLLLSPKATPNKRHQSMKDSVLPDLPPLAPRPPAPTLQDQQKLSAVGLVQHISSLDPRTQGSDWVLRYGQKLPDATPNCTESPTITRRHLAHALLSAAEFVLGVSIVASDKVVTAADSSTSSEFEQGASPQRPHTLYVTQIAPREDPARQLRGLALSAAESLNETIVFAPLTAAHVFILFFVPGLRNPGESEPTNAGSALALGDALLHNAFLSPSFYLPSSKDSNIKHASSESKLPPFLARRPHRTRELLDSLSEAAPWVFSPLNAASQCSFFDRFRGLQTLCLSHCGLTTDALEPLIQWLILLGTDCASTTTASTNSQAAEHQQITLHTLDLSHNFLTSSSLTLLETGLNACPSIISISFRDNPALGLDMDFEDCENLFAVPSPQQSDEERESSDESNHSDNEKEPENAERGKKLLGAENPLEGPSRGPSFTLHRGRRGTNAPPVMSSEERSPSMVLAEDAPQENDPVEVVLLPPPNLEKEQLIHMPPTPPKKKPPSRMKYAHESNYSAVLKVPTVEKVSGSNVEKDDARKAVPSKKANSQTTPPPPPSSLNSPAKKVLAIDSLLPLKVPVEEDLLASTNPPVISARHRPSLFKSNLRRTMQQRYVQFRHTAEARLILEKLVHADAGENLGAWLDEAIDAKLTESHVPHPATPLKVPEKSGEPSSEMPLARAETMVKSPKDAPSGVFPTATATATAGDRLPLPTASTLPPASQKNKDLNQHWTYSQLISLLANCPQLETVDLSFCGLRDTAIVKICSLLHMHYKSLAKQENPTSPSLGLRTATMNFSDSGMAPQLLPPPPPCDEPSSVLRVDSNIVNPSLLDESSVLQKTLSSPLIVGAPLPPSPSRPDGFSTQQTCRIRPSVIMEPLPVSPSMSPSKAMAQQEHQPAAPKQRTFSFQEEPAPMLRPLTTPQQSPQANAPQINTKNRLSRLLLDGAIITQPVATLLLELVENPMCRFKELSLRHIFHCEGPTYRRRIRRAIRRNILTEMRGTNAVRGRRDAFAVQVEPEKNSSFSATLLGGEAEDTLGRSSVKTRAMLETYKLESVLAFHQAEKDCVTGIKQPPQQLLGEETLRAVPSLAQLDAISRQRDTRRELGLGVPQFFRGLSPSKLITRLEQTEDAREQEDNEDDEKDKLQLDHPRSSNGPEESYGSWEVGGLRKGYKPYSSNSPSATKHLS